MSATCDVSNNLRLGVFCCDFGNFVMLLFWYWSKLAVVTRFAFGTWTYHLLSLYRQATDESAWSLCGMSGSLRVYIDEMELCHFLNLRILARQFATTNWLCFLHLRINWNMCNTISIIIYWIHEMFIIIWNMAIRSYYFFQDMRGNDFNSFF
jgi:hypothetical protein